MTTHSVPIYRGTSCQSELALCSVLCSSMHLWFCEMEVVAHDGFKFDVNVLLL